MTNPSLETPYICIIFQANRVEIILSAVVSCSNWKSGETKIAVFLPLWAETKLRMGQVPATKQRNWAHKAALRKSS